MSWLSEWFGKVASGKKPKEAAVEVVSEKIVKAIDAVDEPNTDWVLLSIAQIVDSGDCKGLAKKMYVQLQAAQTQFLLGETGKALATIAVLVDELVKVQK